MTTPHPISRFFAWARPRADAPADDAADMGTAFGLDMSQPDPDDLTAVAGAPTPGEDTDFHSRWG
jgi:hypothetical protein